MEEPVAAEEKHRSAMKMRVTVGAEAAPMCLQRSATPEAVEDAPSLDPWLVVVAELFGRVTTDPESVQGPPVQPAQVDWIRSRGPMMRRR